MKCWRVFPRSIFLCCEGLGVTRAVCCMLHLCSVHFVPASEGWKIGDRACDFVGDDRRRFSEAFRSRVIHLESMERTIQPIIVLLLWNIGTYSLVRQVSLVLVLVKRVRWSQRAGAIAGGLMLFWGCAQGHGHTTERKPWHTCLLWYHHSTGSILMTQYTKLDFEHSFPHPASPTLHSLCLHLYSSLCFSMDVIRLSQSRGDAPYHMHTILHTRI